MCAPLRVRAGNSHTGLEYPQHWHSRTLRISIPIVHTSAFIFFYQCIVLQVVAIPCNLYCGVPGASNALHEAVLLGSKGRARLEELLGPKVFEWTY